MTVLVLEEMADLVERLLEEKEDKGGLDIKRILIDERPDEVSIFIGKTKSHDLLEFAFDVARSYLCVVEIQIYDPKADEISEIHIQLVYEREPLLKLKFESEEPFILQTR